MADRESQSGNGDTRPGRISSVPGLSKRLEKARVRVARTHVKRKVHAAALSTAPNPDRIMLTGERGAPGEQRACPRLEVSLPLQLRRAGAREATDDRCRDLTPTGMFIATGEVLSLGSIIAFECNYGLVRRFGGMARVVWTRPVTNAHGPRGVGVCFLDLDVNGVEAIEFILRRVTEDPDASPTAKVTPHPFAAPAADAPSRPYVRSVTPTSSVVVDPDLAAAASVLTEPRPPANAPAGSAAAVAAGPSPANVATGGGDRKRPAPEPPAAQAIETSTATTPTLVDTPTIRFERPDLPGSRQPRPASASDAAGPAAEDTPDSDIVARRRSEPVKLGKRATDGGGYHVRDAETTVVHSSIPPDRATWRGRPGAASSRPQTPEPSTVVTAAPPQPIGSPDAQSVRSRGDDPLGRTLLGTPRRDVTEAPPPTSPSRTASGETAQPTIVIADAALIESRTSPDGKRTTPQWPPSAGAQTVPEAEEAPQPEADPRADADEVEPSAVARDDTPLPGHGTEAEELDPAWRRQRLAELVAKQSSTGEELEHTRDDRSTSDVLRERVTEVAFSGRGRLLLLGAGLIAALCLLAYFR